MKRNIFVQLIFNFFLAIDQLLNTLMLGNPDETLSSRLGRSIGRERYGWVEIFRFLVDRSFLLLFREKDHCLNSIMPLEQLNMRQYDYEIWSWNIDS